MTSPHDACANLLRAINEAPIGRDWDSESAPALLDFLSADGYVVVRDSSGLLNHGDELTLAPLNNVVHGPLPTDSPTVYPRWRLAGAEVWRRVEAS